MVAVELLQVVEEVVAAKVDPLEAVLMEEAMDPDPEDLMEEEMEITATIEEVLDMEVTMAATTTITTMKMRKNREMPTNLATIQTTTTLTL